MTYYGRWTYKYEIASEKGAAAAILVHETGPAGYPFSVVTGSWGRENFDIRRAGRERRTGSRSRAGSRSTRPRSSSPPAARTSTRSRRPPAAATSARSPLDAKAELRGQEPAPRGPVAERRRPARRVRPEAQATSTSSTPPTGTTSAATRRSTGDQIFNGAADNASGVAALLEIAGAFARLKTAAEAVDPLPGGHRRGEGAARGQVLRRRTRSTRSRRRSPTSTWT